MKGTNFLAPQVKLWNLPMFLKLLKELSWDGSNHGELLLSSLVEC